MNRFVEAARGWIGTPYVHQASTRGAGCDCLGLVRGIWREVLGEEPEDVPAYTPDWSEPQRDEVLLRAAQRRLRAVPAGRDRRPGEVIVFRMRDGGVAKHLGILSRAGARPAFIHAYQGQGVVENTFSAPWARRVAARFDFPTEV